ncbi:MAG: methionine--tRNA ligase [Candidatus Gracilibacteria bacterium]
MNAAPHIGFALEVIQADALARYHRLKGDDVFYMTGVDEHGVKLYETAKEAGMETQKFADMNAEKFRALKGILNLSNDYFIRTTSDQHKKRVQNLWRKLVEKGDIYKDTYKGNYCVGCEAFIPEKDLDENGNCPIHKKKPKQLEEENYFFKLAKYSKKIRELIESDTLKVVPESRKNEMLNIIGEEGLRDVSFSRPKDVLPWGIDVPDDPTQVMYVWCDALSNYITGVGYSEDEAMFKKYWPCDVHLIGKDILRFHAGVWIGMLLSAEIPIPKAVYVHGFITSEGQKMSKSLGNVVDPLEYVEKHGADALRYFLLKEIPTTDDGDFSKDRFVTVYNSELANSLGNLVNRVVMMTEKYAGGKVPDLKMSKDVGNRLKFYEEKYEEAFRSFDLKVACETLVDVVDFGNKYIDEKKPWAMAKAGEKTDQVMYDLLEILSEIYRFSLPVIPNAAEKIAQQLSLENGKIKPNNAVKKGDLLFARIE